MCNYTCRRCDRSFPDDHGGYCRDCVDSLRAGDGEKLMYYERLASALEAQNASLRNGLKKIAEVYSCDGDWRECLACDSTGCVIRAAMEDIGLPGLLASIPEKQDNSTKTGERVGNADQLG